MNCKICGGEMVQKNRGRLFAVGMLMVASITSAFKVSYFWIPAIILFLTGLYLIIWATLGKGSWCRACKRF